MHKFKRILSFLTNIENLFIIYDIWIVLMCACVHTSFLLLTIRPNINTLIVPRNIFLYIFYNLCYRLHPFYKVTNSISVSYIL